jgi:hypothetical protein
MGALVSEAEAIARIIARIEHDRPVAIAGPAEFWARITELSLAEATAALEALAEQGAVRRQTLGDQRFFVADPPHAEERGGGRTPTA